MLEYNCQRTLYTIIKFLPSKGFSIIINAINNVWVKN